jgi:ABC transporter substrate binding protein
VRYFIVILATDVCGQGGSLNDICGVVFAAEQPMYTGHHIFTQLMDHIVFTYAADPVGAGLVDSLARPGGNATGFLVFEYSISGKWLELLKQIAPSVTRVAVLRDSNIPTGPGLFGVIQAMAPSLRVEVNPVNVRDVGEMERAATKSRQARRESSPRSVREPARGSCLRSDQTNRRKGGSCSRSPDVKVQACW